MINFAHRLENQQLHVTFRGDILYAETTDLSAYLEGLLNEDFREAVLDFRNVSGITSSGIGAIIDFYGKLQKSGRAMRIAGMSEKAYSVFKYFKLDELFPIEK